MTGMWSRGRESEVSVPGKEIVIKLVPPSIAWLRNASRFEKAMYEAKFDVKIMPRGFGKAMYEAKISTPIFYSLVVRNPNLFAIVVV